MGKLERDDALGRERPFETHTFKLNAYLTDLQCMSVIATDQNSFNSAIPTEIGRLSQVRELRLGTCLAARSAYRSGWNCCGFPYQYCSLCVFLSHLFVLQMKTFSQGKRNSNEIFCRPVALG